MLKTCSAKRHMQIIDTRSSRITKKWWVKHEKEKKKMFQNQIFLMLLFIAILLTMTFKAHLKFSMHFYQLEVLVNFSSPTFLKTLIKKLMTMKMNCSCRTVDQRRILSYIFIRKLLPQLFIIAKIKHTATPEFAFFSNKIVQHRGLVK